MRLRTVAVLCLLVHLASGVGHAHAGAATSPDYAAALETLGAVSATEQESNSNSNEGLDDSQARRLRYTLLVGAPAITFAYGVHAWDWGESTRFRWGRERWFQKDTDSGGADKLGHAWSHYMVTRVLYSAFLHTEETRERASLYAVLTASLIGTMIEVGDAFTGVYGFSHEDLIADFVGIAAGYAMDRYPILDEYFAFSAFYWPTSGFVDHDDAPLGFAGDYSGWKFTANFKLAGLDRSGVPLPPLFRFLQFDVGYYTLNYTRFDEKTGEPPTRNLFVGLSLNSRELLSLVPWRNRAITVADEALKFIYVKPLRLLKRNSEF